MKERTERVPCPHCQELILPGAIKCRYCGERIVNSKSTYSPKSTYWAWMGTVIVFYILVFLVVGSANMDSAIWLLLVILVDIVLGIWAFSRNLMLFFKPNYPRRFRIATITTLVGFFLLLFNFNAVAAKLDIKSQDKAYRPPTPVPTISSAVNSSPHVTPKPTLVPKKSGATSAPQATPTPTSQLVPCTFSFGTYYMTPDECNHYTSQVNGSKYTYPSYQPAYQSPLPASSAPNYEAELANRQHQECLQNAETAYRSQLRYCDSLSYYGDPRLKDSCISQADQQYARDKGSCN